MSGKVPPSSRSNANRNASVKTARLLKNPRSRADTQSQADSAADLYERFTGHEPEIVGRAQIPNLPAAVAIIGDCDGVLYTTVRDGRTEKYIHKFRAKDRPKLAVAPDGSQILLLGGRYTFTERGIVDHSDPTA